MTPKECAELFVKTTEELNIATQRQMKGILEVIIIGIEAAKSPMGEKADVVQKLTELVEELKNASTGVGQVSVPAVDPTGQNPEKFCSQVEADLNIAMQNYTNNQQSLNEIGSAALAQVLALLIKLHQ